MYAQSQKIGKPFKSSGSKKTKGPKHRLWSSMPERGEP
jgi:hypothetical protein